MSIKYKKIKFKSVTFIPYHVSRIYDQSMNKIWKKLKELCALRQKFVNKITQKKCLICFIYTYYTCILLLNN